MKRRIVLTLAVLGLGLVTMTLAQPSGGESKPQIRQKAERRAQVARLRAEVELWQLEHEVDAQILKQMMNEIRDHEVRKSIASGHSAPIPGPKAGSEPGSKDSATQNDAPIDEASYQRVLEQKKKEFLEKTTLLNEKELELAELEGQLIPGAQ